VPTLKSFQVNVVQYPRIPSRILKGASYEEVVNDETDEAMVETNVNEAGEIMLVLNIRSVKTPRCIA
jgi:hypothetical protein